MDARRLQRRRWILLALFLFVITALGIGFVQNLRRARESVRKQEGGAESRAYAPEFFERPAPPTTGFTGSDACAECHGEIAAKYARHPMGRSLALIDDAEPLESFENNEFAPVGPRRYRVTRTEQGVFHHERMVDLAGETIYDQAVPVRYALGSGQHGRAYLIEQDGYLSQSSIGWYANGKRWDLAPGYRPEIHHRFERPIGNGCLYCHAGRVNERKDGTQRYGEPVFAEMKIGCERCHGPGQQHVERQRAARAEGPDPTIVHPGRLEPDRREAVCNQCHLQGEKTVPRYGRDFFDFRPGERLEETLVVLVHGQRVDSQKKTRPVSQVEQMRASTCFVKSAGKMGCISCHDPHETPAPVERDAYYQGRCATCHSDHGCSLPEAERNAAPANGSCLPCHMPQLDAKDVAHTSLTDHRLQRKPDRAMSVAGQVSPEKLEVFDHAEERLSPREIGRARGIALTELATLTKNEILAARALEFFCPPWVPQDDIEAISIALGHDISSLDSLGQAFQLMDQNDLASLCWLEGLRLQPRNETLLVRQSDALQAAEQWAQALKYLDRAIEVNPHVSIYHGRRAFVLGQLGRIEEGVVSARRALEIDPMMTQVREWLVGVYGRLGRKDERDAERGLLERMNAALRVK